MSTKNRPRSKPAADAREGSAYIVSRRYDAIFFIFSPLIALVFAELLTPLSWPFERTRSLGSVDTRVGIFIGVFTTAHLFAVFFRSHANPMIFSRHRARFITIPILLYIALLNSQWLLISCALLAALWDVYHSSMQNFGLFRIWDARLGNDPLAGRNLDRWLAHVLYIAPILAGPSLHKTLERMDGFSNVGWDLPSQLLTEVTRWQELSAWIVVTASALFLVYYIWSFQRLVSAGYQISRQKMAFVISLGFTSILAWGFLPVLEAFFVANLFHNLQYFGIVWWVEKRNVRRVFGLSRIQGGERIALIAFLGSLWLLAVGTEAGTRSGLHAAFALGIVVALMHFWYDGFIWSVRRREVDPA